MAYLLSPIGNGFQFFTTTGLPLAGGLIYTYQAGSSTPIATYTDSNGTASNTNPIVLGTDGRPPQEIWLLSGYSYKFVLQDANFNHPNLRQPVSNPVQYVSGYICACWINHHVVWVYWVNSCWLCDLQRQQRHS